MSEIICEECGRKQVKIDHGLYIEYICYSCGQDFEKWIEEKAKGER